MSVKNVAIASHSCIKNYSGRKLDNVFSPFPHVQTLREAG